MTLFVWQSSLNFCENTICISVGSLPKKEDQEDFSINENVA